MLRADALALIQIGDRSCDLEDPVVRARRKPEPPHRHLQRALAGVVESTQLAQHSNRDLSIVKAARLLTRPGALNSCTNVGRAFPLVFSAQLAVRHRRDFDVKIDPVEQRPADSAEIALNQSARTSAFP
jgi:hypothetical protein